MDSYGQGILPLISSLSIFIIFMNSERFFSKFINKIAGTMLAVYLIHEHPLSREIIWGSIKRIGLSEPLSIVTFGFGFSLCLLTVCILIELSRLKLLDLFLKKIGSKIQERVFLILKLGKLNK